MRIRNVLKEFEAHLYPVQPGSDIRGKSERKHYGDGTYRFKLSIRNLPLPDGSQIDLWLDDRPMMKLSVQDGKAKIDIEDQGGVGVPAVKAGQILEIKSGEQVLAEGKYEAD